MSVKNKAREKRYMTAEERSIRLMLTKHQVAQAEIAEAEGITESAVNMRLKSLTPSSKEHFENLILKIAKKNQPHKVAS